MIRCTVYVLLLLLIAIISGILTSDIRNSSPENWQSRIGILLSPLISQSKTREIEIYWNNLNIQPGDKISLYEVHPLGSSIVVYQVTPESPNGRQRTGIYAEYVPSSNLSFVQECIKYEVAWLTQRGIKMKNCLKTQPTWMKDRKHMLGNLTISQVFLPGTHDSASYDEEAKRMNIISNFAITQDTDVLGQLIHGVRYLDIRIGRYPHTDEIWWTNHGPFYRSVPLKTVIDQVKKFLDNTEEIVIFDIHEFPIGFDNIWEHSELVSYLENQFRDYYLNHDQGWSITLNDIWSTGRRLIIGYENSWMIHDHGTVWPCVIHQWGNVRTVEDLYKYLNSIESNRANKQRPRSAMAELTANINAILFNPFSSLRDMAYKVNLNVTNWYSTIWQYSANIVAVDFVRSSDIVEVAIKSNENRHLYCL